MRFHDHGTLNKLLWPELNRNDFAKYIEKKVADGSISRGEAVCAVPRIQCENRWCELRRPYYRVFPFVAKSLARLNLEKINGRQITLPIDELLVSFAEGKEPDVGIGGSHLVKSFLVSQIHKEGLRILQVFPTFVGDPPHMTSFISTKLDDRPIEECFIESIGSPESETISPGPLRNLIKMACTLGLLRGNPDLIKPDVLDCDRLKYEETQDSKYVEKATRRGRVGWNIGEGIEKQSHYRRPHLGLRYTGPGGSIPMYVPISECIINSKKLTEVPQGYLDDVEANA